MCIWVIVIFRATKKFGESASNMGKGMMSKLSVVLGVVVNP